MKEPDLLMNMYHRLWEERLDQLDFILDHIKKSTVMSSITKKETKYTQDLPNKKMFVEREFNASQDKVWSAWTQSDLLEKWFAPKPWKARTKSMDFREGGFWLYCMEGPEGEQTWGRSDYKTINPKSSFTVIDSFCDENGNVNNDLPAMHWKTDFMKTGNGTKVVVEITFNSEEDIRTITEMGFKEGFEAAHQNLDELLEED